MSQFSLLVKVINKIIKKIFLIKDFITSIRPDFDSSIETTVLREECNHARARLREKDPNKIFKTAAGKIYGKQPEKKKPAKRQRAASSSTSSISSNENDEELSPRSAAASESIAPTPNYGYAFNYNQSQIQPVQIQHAQIQPVKKKTQVNITFDDDEETLDSAYL